MKKNFAIVLPDKAGSFLGVSRVFRDLDLDILRVNYNKVVDVHTFFLEAEGTEAAIEAAEAELSRRGLHPERASVGDVRLIESRMDSHPGSMVPMLELVDRYGYNISYINARVDHGGEQSVLMGLYVEGEKDFVAFMDEANAICPTVLRRYDKTVDVLDNNLFYVDFALEIGSMFDLDSEQCRSIMINSNRIVQNLERTTNNPYKPFAYLREFADAICGSHGEAYRKNGRVTHFSTAGGVPSVLIEPPCGSNTWLFDCGDTIFAIDSGYSCFRAEFEATLRELFPDWDERCRELFLTHGDVDHAGCCDLFDRVHAVGDVMDNFRFQHAGEPDWRERNPSHAPYVAITNMITGYESPWMSGFHCLGRRPKDAEEPIARVISSTTGDPAWLDVGPLHFEVWEGAGGHVRGETVLIERGQRICVSGDVFINIHGQTKPQRAFNLLSPFLMTSVDSAPELERTERKYLFALLGPGSWQVMGGHGGLLEYEKKE
ncbi:MULTISPECIES: MBL fold metallo-hydrolase [Atopobiaceae]|uniref:Glyoxylase, beta-lactamase superfamily II n=1 Tax=Parafannyhessea umbonata TaxID=604330 RepID=A0A1H6IWN8_9ACTN|nr:MULTISPECIES: MBL fold metallo-hydrolase [Atopobiaceae]SEH50971.1 Glyoxylase, beta-lactamase superfamily II [Parafannyhessea umbonata]SJZ75859.1 Glyoxylase, beta-lactamase superfamily II [Olsenella sp. KH1P3]